MLGSLHIPSWGEHGLPVTALLSSASDLHVWYLCLRDSFFLSGSPWVSLGHPGTL